MRVWVDEGVGGVCVWGCVGGDVWGFVGVCGGCVGGGYILPNQSLANERPISNIAMCTTTHMRMGACTRCVKGRAGCAWG
jgi:hypothetical protein